MTEPWLPVFCAVPLCLAATASPIVCTHMADASTGEWLGNGLFVAANDEDNHLRVYRLPNGGAPLLEWDASAALRLEPDHPEMDIEGSARIGDTLYWITSHAPNRTGKPRPNRRRLFATALSLQDGRPVFRPVGQPVTHLLEALFADPRYAAFALQDGARLPPKTDASLNIEALCDTPDGGLLIGFRSPVPGGLALLAPLNNPAQTVAGQPPALGAPLLLDLGGNGFRSLLRIGDTYLILSGSPRAGGTPRLYRWQGGNTAPHPLPLTGLPDDATPEGLFAETGAAGAPQLYLMSDDGARLIDGQPAKTHPNPARRSFRVFPLAWPSDR